VLEFRKGQRFLFSCPVGTERSFLRLKQPVREGHHPPASQAKVKNGWSFTITLLLL
jgi:hypothetical protein